MFKLLSALLRCDDCSIRVILPHNLVFYFVTLLYVLNHQKALLRWLDYVHSKIQIISISAYPVTVTKV